jgi:N-acyl-D-amino-acid deacylase
MDPAAACFKLLLEEDDILMQDYYMRGEIIEKILKDNNGAIGTDSLFSKQNPHPRTASSYSKLLKKYVFKDKILSLADAVYKTSQRPAEILGLKDRGQIAAGKKADLLIFSREELMQDNKSSGFQGVMINGSWKVKDSKYLKEVRSGQIIKF